jgi:hypothetical protein
MLSIAYGKKRSINQSWKQKRSKTSIERRSNMGRDIYQEMGDKWQSAVVARTEVERFSGGMISGKYLANLDSQGRGPARVRCGRKVGYPVADLVRWMRERSAA